MTYNVFKISFLYFYSICTKFLVFCNDFFLIFLSGLGLFKEVDVFLGNRLGL